MGAWAPVGAALVGWVYIVSMWSCAGVEFELESDRACWREEDAVAVWRAFGIEFDDDPPVAFGCAEDELDDAAGMASVALALAFSFFLSFSCSFSSFLALSRSSSLANVLIAACLDFSVSSSIFLTST